MKLSAEIVEDATRAYWNTTANEYKKRGVPHINLAYDYLGDELKEAERAGIVAAIKAVAAGLADEPSECSDCGCDYVCGPGACCPKHKCGNAFHGPKS